MSLVSTPSGGGGGTTGAGTSGSGENGSKSMSHSSLHASAPTPAAPKIDVIAFSRLKGNTSNKIMFKVYKQNIYLR